MAARNTDQSNLNEERSINEKKQAEKGRRRKVKEIKRNIERKKGAVTVAEVEEMKQRETGRDEGERSNNRQEEENTEKRSISAPAAEGGALVKPPNNQLPVQDRDGGSEDQ